MTPRDLRVLCTALGFTAVVMQGGKLPKKEGALRAAAFAALIEAFCRDALPDVFGSGGGEVPSGKAEGEAAAREKPGVQHHMANAIVRIIRKKGQCQPHDLRGDGFSQHEIALHWPEAYALAEAGLKIGNH